MAKNDYIVPIPRKERPGITVIKGVYYYRATAKAKAIRLLPVGCTKAALLEEFERVTRELQDSRTYERMFQAYMDYLQEEGKEYSPSTMRGYRHAQSMLAKQWPDTDVDDIGAAELTQWFESLHKGHSHKRPNNIRAYMINMVRWARGRELIETAAVLETTVVKKRNDEVEAAEARQERELTWTEFWTAYNAAGPQLRICMLLGALTGMRVTDCAKVKLSDITEDGIKVRQSKTKVKQTKAWNDTLRRVLELHKEQFIRGTEGTAIYAERVQNIETLIYNRDGKAYRPESLSHMMIALREDLAKAGFDMWWNTHENKRLFVTELNRQEDGDLSKVAKATGNASIHTLRGSYLKGYTLAQTITGEASANDAWVAPHSYGQVSFAMHG